MSLADDLRLVAMTLEGMPGSAARSVARELRLVEIGYTRALEARSCEDYLGAAMWKRLAVESALRTAWLAGDDWTADEAGELVLQRDQVTQRCDRLEARDTLNLLAAYKAITEEGGGESDPALIEAVRSLADSQALDPAPKNLRDLAQNTPQKALYAQHRFSSAVLHPGALAGELNAQLKATELLDQIAVVAVMLGRAFSRVL